MEQIKTEILNTGYDWVLAEITSKRTAIIKGISQNYEIGYDDIVIFDPETDEITQVIKKKNNTVFIKFEENKVNFSKIDMYFAKNNIHTESLMFGLAGLAIPVNISEEDFQIILYNCPVTCELLREEECEIESDDDEEDDNDECY
jgi:hypothetical protein